MARIDEYNTRVFLDRAQPSNIEAAGRINGLNKAAQLYSDNQVLQQSTERIVRVNDEIQRQRQAQGRVKAAERFNQYQRQRMDWEEETRAQRMTSPDGYDKDLDGWIQGQVDDIDDERMNGDNSDAPFDMEYFRQLMDNDRTQAKASALDWERGMRVKNTVVGAEQNLDARNANYALSNPGLGSLSKELQWQRDYANKTGALVLDAEQNQRLFTYGADKATRITFDNMKQNQPEKLRDVLDYGTATQDQLIGRTIDVIEGGDKLVTDKGGLTRYGISEKANPGVDIKTLTRDGAIEIYKQKYWDPGLDKITPAMRAVAFDALVNHGNDKDTWSMITKANGDPYALLALRQAKYNDLVASDATNQQYANGWNNRVKNMTQYVDTLQGEGAEFMKVASLVDPSIIIQTQAELPGAIAAKERQAEQQRQVMVTDFNARFKDANDNMVNSFEPVDQGEIDDLRQRAITTEDPKAIEQVNALENTRTFVGTLKGMSTPQLQSTVRSLSADVNKASSPENRARLEIAQKVLDNQIKGIKEEGLAYYGRTGQAAMPQPLNYQDPTQTTTELLNRQFTTAAIHQKNGETVSPLLPTEVQDLKKLQDTLSADQFAGVMSSFKVLSPNNQILVAQQLKETMPLAAAVLGQDNPGVTRQILRGGKIDPTYSQDKMKGAINTMLSGLHVDPSANAQLAPALEAWYKADQFDAGVAEEEVDPDRLDRALTAVVGPTVDLNGWFSGYGGQAKIFSFKDPKTQDYVADDQIYDMWNGITDDQLKTLNGGKQPVDVKGRPIMASELKREWLPVSAGDGVYNLVTRRTNVFAPAGPNTTERLVINGPALLELHNKAMKKARADYGQP